MSTKTSFSELAEMVGSSADALKDLALAAGVKVEDDGLTQEDFAKVVLHMSTVSATEPGKTETLKSDSQAAPKRKVSSSQTVAVHTKRRRVIETESEVKTQPEEKPSSQAPEIKKVQDDVASEPKPSAPEPSKATSAAPTKPEASVEKRKENVEKREYPRTPKQGTRRELLQRQNQGPKTRRGMLDAARIGDDSGVRRRRRRPRPQAEQYTGPIICDVELSEDETVTVASIASAMKLKGTEVIKKLMELGEMVSINEHIDYSTAALVVEELGHKVVIVQRQTSEDKAQAIITMSGKDEPRAPVVTVMGHVDHGKTSLLDYIRETKVTDKEAGGITQHIGAYHVETEKGAVTFLDTPGHAAFSAMRARGAKSTDIVILVVAADDGVKPQTKEAIQHARAAGVPLVVAINKIDKEGINQDQVRSELSTEEVISEEWGGDTMFVPVSAKTGEGIDKLLDSIILQSEVLELKAPVDVPASGIVVEAKLEKGRGAVATILVQRGQLKAGDIVVAGATYGRVRKMRDAANHNLVDAGPSIPVEIIGLDRVPHAGETFAVMSSEQDAREVAEYREQTARDAELAKRKRGMNLLENFGSDNIPTLNVVLKADVQGSLDALEVELGKVVEGQEDVARIKVVGTGVGAVSETDVLLAQASNAIVLGFNVRADEKAKAKAKEQATEVGFYSVIYDLVDRAKQVLEGKLEPDIKEKVVGIAEVKEVFRSSKAGAIAGSIVIEGTVKRFLPVRVIREGVVIYEGNKLESLRRFKDDVKEVSTGIECGMSVENYPDVKPRDRIEVFEKLEESRTL